VAQDAYARQYGVYSETPDAVPLVGQVSPHSRVCYLLGCNALGQAVLSYAATLVPGLLGYRDLTDPEREAMELMSVRRFSLLPAVQGDVA
jgi:glycine/D-amino acid oxidase-like deaminating enzyme